ncbi:MAG: DUF1697 domain-containing protein [Thermoplasmata archaeon]|jgi:uncharacterized protein (DUF1697 family)
MTVYVGLLRAVNLGGSTQVSMDALRTLLAQMGLEGVRTLLQSGNVVFRSHARDPAVLERQLQDRVARDLKVRTDFFLRSSEAWSSIVRANPFPREADAAPGYLVVTALKDAPTPENWKALDAAIRGPERVRGIGREAYIVYPNGQGRSRLTIALIERSLGTRGTSRNWNTVTKLAHIVKGFEP